MPLRRLRQSVRLDGASQATHSPSGENSTNPPGTFATRSKRERAAT